MPLNSVQLLFFRLAECIVPATQREAWRREWLGELAALAERADGWPAQRRRLMRDGLRVAWRDAWWLRLHPERGLERPLHALHAPLGTRDENLFATLGRDLRFGLRRLRRSLGFSSTVLVFLSLSIAAATAVFALVRSIVLEPLAYAQSERLVRVVGVDLGEGQEDWMSMREVERLREATQSLEAIGHSTTFPATWQGEEGRRRIQRGFVSAEYFSLLGLDALHGRLLGPSEDDRTALVLSYDFWSREWHGDPAVLGRPFVVDDQTYTIVGVTSPSAYTHDFSTPPADIWIRFEPPRGNENLDFRIFTAIARLDTEHDLLSAQAEASALSARMAADHSELYEGWRLKVEPLKDTVLAGADRPLILLFSCLGLLLFGICANLANVVMARLLGRRDEVLVHLALGGRRSAIARQLAIEGALLSAAGCGLGLFLARWGLETLPLWLAFDLPRTQEIALGWQGPTFALAITVLMTLLFAWLPARLGARTGLTRDLRGGRATDRSLSRLRSLMISAQVAIALPLLIVAGLLVGTLSDQRRSDLGLQVEGLAGLRVSIPFRQAPEPAQREQYFANLVESLRNRHDVTHAAATLQMPLVVHQADRTRFRVQGKPSDSAEAPRALYQVVTAGYFETLGVALLEGRDFEPKDRVDGLPVVIVNRELQRRHFGDRSPVGQQIDVELSIAGEPTLRKVVGVVDDIAQLGPAAPREPMVFLPHTQVSWPSMTVVVRSAGPTQPILRHLQQQALDTEIAATLEPPVLAADALRDLLGPLRSAAVLAAAFAAFAAALCLLGLYGLLSYDVQQSRRECAIRMAVGASSTTIRFHFLGRATLLVGLGTLFGLGLSWLAARMLGSVVDVVPQLDLALFLVVPACLMIVAVAAGWLPTARAVSTSPASLLRSD